MNPETPLVYAGAQPDVDELVRQFALCTPWTGGDWNRVTTNEDIRFCRWANQAADFKKHDTDAEAAFPFNGASDSRQPLADAIINELVAISVNAFWRAMVRPKAGATEESNYGVKLLEHLINSVLYQDLLREVELSEQYRQTTGWVIIHPSWRREISLENVEVELDALVALAERMAPEYPDSPLAQLPALILDPTQEDAAAGVLAMLYDHYARQQVMQLVDVKLPPLRPARLRQAVRELRDEGAASLPIPRVTKNQPCVCALKPWVEVFIPPETTDLQCAGIVFRRQWLSEVQLRALARLEGWNEAWVEQAVKQKGQFTAWQMLQSGVTFNSAWTSTQTNEDRIEVVWACYRLLDADNVPGVYYTVFHPAFSKDAQNRPSLADHGLLDYARGQLPYVAGASENTSRQICWSRGVPEIVASWQREIKCHRDALVDLTSIAVSPPRIEYARAGALNSKFKFGPNVANTCIPGFEPRLMEIPTRGAPVAFELMERIEHDVDNHFGRLSEKVLPARQQAKQQMHVNGFLLLWSEVFQQMLGLCQQYLPDAEFAQATGAPQGWLDQRRQTPGALYAELHFDVRELDPDYVMMQLKTVNEAIVPGDVGGVIDRAKFTRLQLRAINPNLARELVADNQAASQRLFEQVKTDVAFMFLGNEPSYTENDPTAQAKLQFAAQIVQANPTYQQGLQQGGRFAELLQSYAKNLQFSVTQEQNKMVGRIGVQPEGMR
ncbi:MAG: hypothetical protein HW378_195 [Anaerolineales bacterium]|nr:hypothetical protein [Anaerolineales bacterium]